MAHNVAVRLEKSVAAFETAVRASTPEYGPAGSGSALADIRSNKLFVMDTLSRLDEVRQMIAQIDIPVRQVLIEARIVEADDRFSRNLGTKLGYYDRRSTIYRTAARTNPVTGETEAVNVPVHGPGSSLGNRIGYGTI